MAKRARVSTPSGPATSMRVYRLVGDPTRGAACERELLEQHECVDWSVTDRIVSRRGGYERGARYRVELRDERGQLARVLTLIGGSGERVGRTRRARVSPENRDAVAEEAPPRHATRSVSFTHNARRPAVEHAVPSPLEAPAPVVAPPPAPAPASAASIEQQLLELQLAGARAMQEAQTQMMVAAMQAAMARRAQQAAQARRVQRLNEAAELIRALQRAGHAPSKLGTIQLLAAAWG